MTSWWRLRTQAFLVLGVLLFLIVFLGAYALSETKRHALEADELLGANFTATSLLKQIESARAERARAVAKFHVTDDRAYELLARRQTESIAALTDRLLIASSNDSAARALVAELQMAQKAESTLDVRQAKRVAHAIRGLDQRLEGERAERASRLRRAAKDLDKIIFVAFVVALGVTGWLSILLYHALVKPLESIKRAARRIREGELSCRIEKFRGFSELADVRDEFNLMAARVEELDRMKGDFLSTVSHELRTPLTALKEGLNLMTEKQDKLSPQATARALEVCNQSAKRLEAMIRNLLNHAKMESGFYSFDERPKDFLAVVESAIQGMKPIAERRGIAITLSVLTSQRLAAFSAEGILHAVENLLLNAIKYGDPAHAVSVEVRHIQQQPVSQLGVRVTNYGKGLLPSELKLVFEKFFRGANADGQKGVGLGLSVVKRIIEAHHGNVTAESSDGVTTFSFCIPQRYESLALGRALAEVRA